MLINAEFGKWRTFFWPIHRHELKKFIPMLLIYSLVAFVYGILRPYKESMVVTATQSGAETLPFIKVWVILPCALLLMFLFTRLSNRFTREKVFYIMISIFLCFFILFAFVLFPAHKALHPHAFADSAQAILPESFKGLVAVFRNWTFTLFYVMSDLWSTTIMSVLFWGFANEVTNVGEAKRYYILWSIGANLAGVIAAQITVHLSAKSEWDQSILLVNCIVILCSILTIALFRYLNTHLALKESTPTDKTPFQKPKLSMRKNFSYLLKSKYLMCISVIVLAYNLTINLIDIVWKKPS